MLRVPFRLLRTLVIAVPLAIAACRAQPAPQATTPAPVSPDVWAVVDGREIRRDDVEKAYRRITQPSQTLSDEEVLTAKVNLLDQIIVQDLLLAKARELKIEVPESELDAEFSDGKKSLSDTAFNQELASRNLTAADMREGLRRDLLARKVVEQEVSLKVTVTEREVNDFFQTNKAQFNLPEDSYRLGQIVVTAVKEAQITNRTGDDATTPQGASEKAQMLMERLKAGTPFGDLAMDYSEDPESAPRGGDVGLVPMSALRQIAPPLRDAVLKTQPGTVNLVPMPGGYTIVAVAEKQLKGQRDLSMPDVRQGIENTLRGRREQLLRTAYVEAMRNRASVVNYLVRRIVDGAGSLPPSVVPIAPKPAS